MSSTMHVHAGDGLEGPDVAALLADDPALHLLGRQRDHRDDALRARRTGEPLHRGGDDPPRALLRRAVEPSPRPAASRPRPRARRARRPAAPVARASSSGEPGHDSSSRRPRPSRRPPRPRPRARPAPLGRPACGPPPRPRAPSLSFAPRSSASRSATRSSRPTASASRAGLGPDRLRRPARPASRAASASRRASSTRIRATRQASSSTRMIRDLAHPIARLLRRLSRSAPVGSQRRRAPIVHHLAHKSAARPGE